MSYYHPKCPFQITCSNSVLIVFLHVFVTWKSRNGSHAHNAIKSSLVSLIFSLFLLLFFSFLCFFNCFYFFHLSALDYSLTLRDGPGSYAGRVEVNNNGTWGSLCDTDLTIDVGHVICRQLGYPRAIATPCCNAFGPGNSPFWLYDVKCKGNESSLAECDFKTGAPNICDQRYDFASVVCENRSITDSKFMSN